MTQLTIGTEKHLVATLMEAVFTCGKKGSQVFMTENGIKELQRMMKDQKILVVDFSLPVKPEYVNGWEFVEGGAMTNREHQQISASIRNVQR